jgi:hypothetical protein
MKAKTKKNEKCILQSISFTLNKSARKQMVKSTFYLKLSEQQNKERTLECQKE